MTGKNHDTVKIHCRITSFLLVILLTWHVVSFAFIFQNSKEQRSLFGLLSLPCIPSADTNEAAENPGAGMPEEKAETGTGSPSEYMLDYESSAHREKTQLKYNNHLSSGIYIAFHGELISPPPELF